MHLNPSLNGEGGRRIDETRGIFRTLPTHFMALPESELPTGQESEEVAVPACATFT